MAVSPKVGRAAPAALLLGKALAVCLLPVMLTSTPATAAAPPTYSLSLSEVTPADGYSQPVAAYGATLDINARLSSSPSPIYTLFVEVATQNVTGQDGTLSDDNRVLSATANRTDTDPSVYKGKFYNVSALAPGTYYWQFSSPCVISDTSGATSGTCMSPVYTLNITQPVAPPPPPPMTVPVKASSRISLSAKVPWSTNGWKVTATLSRNGTPSARAKLVGQYRTNRSWRTDGAWRTNRYGKLRISSMVRPDALSTGSYSRATTRPSRAAQRRSASRGVAKSIDLHGSPTGRQGVPEARGLQARCGGRPVPPPSGLVSPCGDSAVRLSRPSDAVHDVQVGMYRLAGVVYLAESSTPATVAPQY